MSEDVELSAISMDFGDFRAVNNVDVTIKAGEFFSFLGPSGCGKTTILRLISGFMEPTAGVVKIGSADMRGIRPNMRAELRAIQKRTNVTFIYITHDQGEALAMSDRVGVMSQGVLQQVGTPMEIYNNPANGFVASFVGENNVFAGTVKDVAGSIASFETSSGRFSTRLGLGIKAGDMAKLYIRPEHSTLQASAATTSNSIPVEVSEIAFEGNFVNVFVRDAHDVLHMVQAKNDTSQQLPAIGAKMHMAFAPEHAVVLADAVNNTHG